jgi:hypothetical protein
MQRGYTVCIVGEDEINFAFILYYSFALVQK